MSSPQPHEAALPKRNHRRPQLSTNLDISSDNAENSGFACPFFRKEPTRHMDCLSRKLMRVCDVKQHIRRRHIKDLVSKCPICEAAFRLPSERDEHESLSICSFAFKTASHAVEQGMLNELRSHRKMTYADLCGILFGEEGKGLNPYLEPILIETSGMVWDFWQSERETILQNLANNQDAFALTNDKNIIDEVMNQFRLQFEQRVNNSSLPVTTSLPTPKIPQESQETTVGITAFTVDSYNIQTSISANEGAQGFPSQFSMFSDLSDLMAGPYNEQLGSIICTNGPQRNENSFSFLEPESHNTLEESTWRIFDQRDSEGF